MVWYGMIWYGTHTGSWEAGMYISEPVQQGSRYWYVMEWYGMIYNHNVYLVGETDIFN